LREYDGNKSIIVYEMSPVQDWNELTHHMFETIYVHLQNTRGPVPVSEQAMMTYYTGC
jgi:hypothetical protein